MSRYLDEDYQQYVYDIEGCRYEVNHICFNNMSKWYGKKCHVEETKCEKFKKENRKKGRIF